MAPAATKRSSCMAPSGIGAKGFRVYDWALIPAATAHHEYMIRRSIDDGELAFYHCYNPGHAGFGERMAVLVGAIEQQSGARLPGTRRLANRSRAARDGIVIPPEVEAAASA